MIQELRAQFEVKWKEIQRVYVLGLPSQITLSRTTLRLMKQAAFDAYVQGRTDEMARQLTMSRATVTVRRARIGRRGEAGVGPKAQTADQGGER